MSQPRQANANWTNLVVALRWRLWKWQLRDVYLKKGHVGAIVAVVAFVIVRVVDKGTVFFRYTISCRNTVNMIVSTAIQGQKTIIIHCQGVFFSPFTTRAPWTEAQLKLSAEVSLHSHQWRCSVKSWNEDHFKTTIWDWLTLNNNK